MKKTKQTNYGAAEYNEKNGKNAIVKSRHNQA